MRFLLFVTFWIFQGHAQPDTHMHSTTMTFDMDSPPSSTCPNGMIRPPELPFPTHPVALTDPEKVQRFLAWGEYQRRCFYDGFLNNVVHIDAGNLFGNMIRDDTLFCTAVRDGSDEDCVKMKDNLIHWDLFRNVFDVTRVTTNTIELGGNLVRVNGTFDGKLQVAISGFLVGYEVRLYAHPSVCTFLTWKQFMDDFDETWIFNDDGTWNKFIIRDDRYIGSSMKEWARTTLSAAFATGDKPIMELLERYGHHLVVDHAQKHKYWKLDLRDTSTKVFIGFLVIWFLCAPVGIVYVAMHCCGNSGKHSFAKIRNDVSDTETEDE